MVTISMLQKLFFASLMMLVWSQDYTLSLSACVTAEVIEDGPLFYFEEFGYNWRCVNGYLEEVLYTDGSCTDELYTYKYRTDVCLDTDSPDFYWRDEEWLDDVYLPAVKITCSYITSAVYMDRCYSSEASSDESDYNSISTTYHDTDLCYHHDDRDWATTKHCDAYMQSVRAVYDVYYRGSDTQAEDCGEPFIEIVRVLEEGKCFGELYDGYYYNAYRYDCSYEEFERFDCDQDDVVEEYNRYFNQKVDVVDPAEYWEVDFGHSFPAFYSKQTIVEVDSCDIDQASINFRAGLESDNTGDVLLRMDVTANGGCNNWVPDHDDIYWTGVVDYSVSRSFRAWCYEGWIRITSCPEADYDPNDLERQMPDYSEYITSVPTPSPTSSPTTSNPTSSPITSSPTSSPTTSSPTSSPTTSNPTSSPTTSSPTTSSPTSSPTTPLAVRSTDSAANLGNLVLAACLACCILIIVGCWWSRSAKPKMLQQGSQMTSTKPTSPIEHEGNFTVKVRSRNFR